MSAITIYKYTGGSTSNPISFSIKKISETITSKNKIYEIPGADHIIVPLGRKGPILGVDFSIFSAVDYQLLFDYYKGGNYITIGTSDIVELPTSTIWYIDDRSVQRSGGYLNRWDVTLKLVRVYGDVIEV